MNKENFSNLIKQNKVVIYGAGTVAKEVAYCLMQEPYQVEVSSFMVTELANNPQCIMGVPVIDVQRGKQNYKNAVILIAVMDKYLEEIVENLEKEEFEQIIPLTFESDLWGTIREGYYKHNLLEQGKKYISLHDAMNQVDLLEDIPQNNVSVYMAKCHVDKKLNVNLDEFNWEIPIQVGAALTDQRIAEVTDNTGENISERNSEYCELTALYWIWKNDTSKYVGLCHYRRHFCLKESWLNKLVNSDIDVVLTIPIMNYPDVRTIYINDHNERDWDIMLEAIEQLQPTYRETAERLQKGMFYYGYNMLIAKKEVFDAYCEWMFPILSYCEKKCGRKENTYQNRYIGFLAERLLSVYFMHNEDRYRIVHAEKKFLM